MSVNVRLNLTPQCRSGAAATEFDGLYWHLHLIENLKRVTQAERNAFHDRANHVSPCMTRSDAHERGSSRWIQMRRGAAHPMRSRAHPPRKSGLGLNAGIGQALGSPPTPASGPGQQGPKCQTLPLDPTLVN